MRVLPGMETWTGLQAWHPAESHPSGVCLPASGLSYCPESLGRASNSMLADSFVSWATAWSRLWSPVGMLLLSQQDLDSPRVWLSVLWGLFISCRMSLRHHGFTDRAAGQRAVWRALLKGPFFGC